MRIIIIITLLHSLIIAECNSQLLSLQSLKKSSIKDTLDDFASYCKFGININDAITLKELKSKKNTLSLQDASLVDILKLLLNNNNFSYTFNDNLLTINYITTATYNLDYIVTHRKSSSNTDIMMQSQKSQNSNSKSNTTVGANISSGENFTLWDKEFKKEIMSILNIPTDKYRVKNILLNKQAGLITISATSNQHKRIQQYLKLLKKKLQSQVLIDLKIYSVELNSDNTTGIDWSQLSKILDFSTTVSGTISTPILNVGQNLTFESLINFLKSQGSVKSISNPKVLTLNNQPALISVGKEIYYKLTSTITTVSTTTISQNSESIQSVFAGILLDVTPSISQNGEIVLKINPSISSLDSYISGDDEVRIMPPDLNKKQISSVIRLKNKDSIILGGLIDTTKILKETKVPFLGDIWLLGWFFSSKQIIDVTKELVIVITPYIIQNSQKISLKDISYKTIKVK